MTTTPKTTAAHAFGWDEIHAGLCCDCCTGYCPKSDYEGVSDWKPIRFAHAGREWLSDKFVCLDIASLTYVPDEVITPSGDTQFPFPTRATGPATGLIGSRTMEFLARMPDLELADSDYPDVHALVRDGEMVGFAKAAVGGYKGLPVEYLARARRMAAHLEGCGEAPLIAATHAIVAWLATEEAS